MKAFIATFQIGFKYLWRNPIDVAILIVFPIVLILVLGTALGTYIAPDNSLSPAPVAIAAKQDGALIGFLRSEEISRFFEFEFTDKERAEVLAAEGSVAAAVIEDDSGITVIIKTGAGIQPNAGIHASLTLSVIDSYKQIGAAASIAAMSGRDVYALLGISPEVTDIPLGNRIPNAFDYYAITMLVMILMYTGLNGMSLFQKGLISETGNRARTAPISNPSLIGGLFIASAVTSYLQGMVTFVFSGLAYGVYWGERIPLVLLTLFVVVLFSQALCICIFMALRNQGAATGITQALIWIATFVSSGYMRVSFGELDSIFQYAPNAMAHTVIFGAIYGGNESNMMLSFFALLGTGIVLFCFAFLLGRRRIK